MRKLATVVLAILACTALGAPAQAQLPNLFYAEETKDGRVFVFNTAQRLETWRASGEMGTAISLIGRGANGETVIGENETALDLYFFKHNLPGYERTLPKPEKPFDERIFHKDGKTNIVSKKATIQISNRVQVRYTFLDRTQNPIGSFRIRRAKTTFEGSAYDGLWRFKVQANWVGGTNVNAVTAVNKTIQIDSTRSETVVGSITSTTSRGPVLEDAEIWWAKYRMATVWLGQGKAYFGRQQLTSSGKLQFVDRWLGDARFAPGRDQGLGLVGTDANKHFEYNAATYNGNLLNQQLNDNVEHMYIGRVVWTPLGEYKLEESSLDYPEQPKVVVGASGLANTLTSSNVDTDILRAGTEAGFKWRGFNSVGEFYYEEAERSNTTYVSRGGYLQAGYLFPNRKFEVAGRWAAFDLGTTLFSFRDLNTNALEEVREIGLAASWYFDQHTHKFQANWIRYEDTKADLTLDEFAAQLQLVF